MPIPIIDPTTSILTGIKGSFFSYQPAATETPTSWAATGLPAGITINGTTGLISGTPTTSGTFNVKLVATNGSGASVAIYAAIGIEANQLEAGAGVEIDIELETGFVRGPYAAASDFALYAKSGDLIPLLIGFTKGGVLQPLPLALLRVALKEYETESRVSLNDGAEFETIGSYDTTRFRVLADFSSATITNWLANYEADEGTHFIALGEVEAVIVEAAIGGGTVDAPRSSQVFKVFLERQIIPVP